MDEPRRAATRLLGDLPEAALDWELSSNRQLRENNGIAWYGDSVWTTYTGTWQDDPQDNKAVISSNRIDWPAP